MAERKSCLWIKVEVSAGSSVEHAAEDSVAMARRLGCNVTTQFNGRTLRVTSRSTVEDIVSDYLGRID